jgi:hypothetical protein
MILNPTIYGELSSYQRPPDWLDISSVAANEIKLLVCDRQLATTAFAVTTSAGTYTIDWGDGTVETNRVSATTYQHTYTTGGKTCGMGYNTWAIRIYGASGNITSFGIRRHDLTLENQYTNILWANFNLPNATTYANTFYMSNNTAIDLHEVTISSFASVTSVASAFKNAQSLRKVNLPSSWGAVTTCDSMFSGCSELSTVTLPSSWGSVGITSSMFLNCYSLQDLTLPSSIGDMSSCARMLEFCCGLKRVVNLDKLGSTVRQCDMTGLLFRAAVLDQDVALNSLISRIALNGNTAMPMKLANVRLTNAGSTYGGTSPQINVSYTNMSAAQLNQLFTDLPTLTGKTITITGAAGAASCNQSIATAKGWTVTN